MADFVPCDRLLQKVYSGLTGTEGVHGKTPLFEAPPLRTLLFGGGQEPITLGGTISML